MDIAHLHLILNHIPVTASIFGFIILAVGIILRSVPIRNVGLGFLVLAALVAIPVYLTGESAEEIVEEIQRADESFIDKHLVAAQLSLALAFVSGLLALGALLPMRAAFARLRGYLVLSALLASVFTCSSMAWTANLGGQIRHTEIRVGAQTGNQSATDRKNGSREQRTDSDDDDR